MGLKRDPGNGGKNNLSPKTIGVLGGMGPEATERFFHLLICLTAAGCDQEHARVLIWSDPTIPPRSEAILGGGPDPFPALRRGLRILERGGAGVIAMPCITAHFWAPRLKAAAEVPFIDLIEETVKAGARRIPGLKTVGLLSTTGTIRSGILHAAFARRGVTVMTPDERGQERIMDAVFGPAGVKAGFTSGRPRETVVRAARRLAARGAEAVMAGCTEIPLVLRAGDLAVPFLDPLEIGARACLRKAGFPLRTP